jgi:hypothetical protein
LPYHLLPAPSDFRAFASLVSKLRQAHRHLVGMNLVQLQLRFLSLCWSLNVYGCTFFKAFMLMAKASDWQYFIESRKQNLQYK